MAAPDNKFLNRFTASFAPVVFFLALLGSPEAVYPGSSQNLVENYPGGGVHFKIEADEHRQPHGWSREYSETGTLKSERHYQHGVRDGISRLYYTTGELMTEWVYRDGLRHGASLGYFKNGRIKDKGVYRDDLLEGPVLMYYSGGALKARMNFKRDRPEGKSTTYYENGKVRYIYHYRKGRALAREEYRPDGKLLRKQEFPQPPVPP